ncbi:MAG: PIN domain-containing protein [Spirochaetales bacterium]|nr:PIN domain-containing protein [Spirochaetales bacterium]
MTIALPATGKIFIDTNVFVYSADNDTPGKRDVARGLVSALLDDRRGTVSTQVLIESYNAFFKKLSISKSHARTLTTTISRFEVIPTDVNLIDTAMVIHQTEPLSFWDALILAAASAANCRTILTEDMSDGRMISGVRVVNPFGGR